MPDKHTVYYMFSMNCLKCAFERNMYNHINNTINFKDDYEKNRNFKL